MIAVGLVFASTLACGSTDVGADGGEIPATDDSAQPAEQDPAVTAPQPTATREPRPTAAPTTADEPIVFGDQFPEVLGVEVTVAAERNFRFAVTLSSPYDTPERYADAWRVLDGEDNELGIRVLGHDHANEQPFTRSANIEVPSGTTTVFVEGRDQANGWSGQRFVVAMP